MADILCLGWAFRLFRLRPATSPSPPDGGGFGHRIGGGRFLARRRAQAGPCPPTNGRKLSALLEERPAGTAGAKLFLVTPRLGTISPWSSKATDIVLNCDLEAIERIERVVAFQVVARGGWP